MSGICGARSIYMKRHDGYANCGLPEGHDGEHQEHRPDECVTLVWGDGEQPVPVPNTATPYLFND